MCAGTTRTPASAKGSKVGDLMVEGTYIFDCEVFAYDWLFDFKDVSSISIGVYLLSNFRTLVSTVTLV